jgi:creatinine amidohydrolase
MFWSQRTWAELPGDLAAVQNAALLPVGATEQHGPHLGCGVDAVLAERLCTAVAERTRVPMLPTLPYGCSLGHSQRWPGTIGVQPVTLIELVAEIGRLGLPERRAPAVHGQHARDQRRAAALRARDAARTA